MFLTIVTSSSSNSCDNFIATKFNAFEISSVKNLTSTHLAISGWTITVLEYLPHCGNTSYITGCPANCANAIKVCICSLALMPFSIKPLSVRRSLTSSVLADK